MKKKNFKWWIVLPSLITTLPLIAAACDNTDNNLKPNPVPPTPEPEPGPKPPTPNPNPQPSPKPEPIPPTPPNPQPEPSPNPTPKPPKPDDDMDKDEKPKLITLSEDQKKEVIDIFGFDKKMMVSSNLEKLVEKSTNKIKVLKAEAISFDDLEGILSLSITGSYNNQNFSINDYQITGFQNYSALKNLTNFIVSINKNSLIEDNKTNQDISSFVNHDLLKYLNINSNNISLNDLFNRKIIELEYANLNRKKDRLTFSFNYLYKSKKMGKIQNIEKISIIGTRIFVSNEKINDKDILNFLLDKKVKIKENLNKKIFASVYEGRENNAKNSIVSTFFEFDENDNKKYFKEQNGLLSIQIDKIKSNDVEGFLLISYFVKYENENSKTKIIKLENFLNAKNDNDLKSEFFLTTTNNNKFKQNLENLYKQYENDANAKNIKINDTSSLMKYFGFVLDWSIIREDDNQLQDKFMVDDTKSYWEFKYKNMKISDLLNTRSGILLEDSRTNKDKIIFNLLQVKPLEISNLIINKQEKSLTADFIYEIKFFVYNSNNIESKNTSEISVTQKTKITWKQQN